MSGPDKSREAFEAWCETCDERSSWHAWQASRAAALEEAAQVCDQRAADHEEDAATADPQYATNFLVCAKHERRCAEAIRAIARKE